MNVKITSNDAGITVREYIRGKLGFSSAMLKKLKFTEGGITVNGGFVTVRHILEEGETLSLRCEDTPEDTSPYIIPSDAKVEIIYEDEFITAVNKPPGMPAHPSYGHRDDTVANALAARYRNAPYVFRPVNRLDRDTSGVMLTANTRLASYQMYRLMTEGKIRKSYIAVLDGVPDRKFGKLESYIRRRGDSIIEREECAKDEGGKYALTEFHVIYSNGQKSIVLAHPVTGRTHQLRVQFAGIGCPIAGDSMYGTKSGLIGRQALHAVRTEFVHPFTGDMMYLKAPAPEDIKTLVSEELGDMDASLKALIYRGERHCGD